MSDPTYEQVLSLPASFDRTVTADFIDVNGHMNIGDYFRLASWAPWQRLEEAVIGSDYIATRGVSFFTVEHSIRYLGELREGERFSVHSAYVSRTARTLHSASYVVDRERARLACAMEIVYVHVSMSDRRAAPIPDDVAAALDADIAAHGGDWLSSASRLTLRRSGAPEGGKITP